MAKKQINVSDELPDAVEADEAIGTGNDARVAMLNKIGDGNDVDRAEDLADITDEGTTEPFEAPKGDEEVVEEPAVEEPVVEETVEEPAPVEAKTKIKVNGKEIELTQAELIARAQKVEAADEYLAEAVRIRKEAQPPEKDAATDEDEERALVRAIQMGTEEEAMAAIRKMRQPPSFTKDDLARTVDERLTFKEATRRFGTEYKDLMDDPVLKQMVLSRDQELINKGDSRDYWTRYEEIGNSVRTWRDGLIKSNAPPIPQDKLARKASIAPPAKAASVKAAQPVDEEDKDENVSDVISAIAKARGGPQWMRS